MPQQPVWRACSQRAETRPLVPESPTGFGAGGGANAAAGPRAGWPLQSRSIRLDSGGADQRHQVDPAGAERSSQLWSNGARATTLPCWAIGSRR
jgi:hypothetical protein